MVSAKRLDGILMPDNLKSILIKDEMKLVEMKETVLEIPFVLWLRQEHQNLVPLLKAEFSK